MGIALIVVLVSLAVAAASGALPDSRDEDYSVGAILRTRRTRTQ